MIVDTSAVVAILLAESDAARYERAISMAWPRRMSVVALLETTMVIEGRSGPDAGDDLDLFLREADIELEPVTLEQVEAARHAWRRFGKGHHPAALRLRRLFRLCAREHETRTVAVQGQRFRPDRRRSGVKRDGRSSKRRARCLRPAGGGRQSGDMAAGRCGLMDRFS